MVPGFGTWYPAQYGGTKVPKLDRACDALGALGKMHTPASPAVSSWAGLGWGEGSGGCSRSPPRSSSVAAVSGSGGPLCGLGHLAQGIGQRAMGPEVGWSYRLDLKAEGHS